VPGNFWKIHVRSLLEGKKKSPLLNGFSNFVTKFLFRFLQISFFTTTGSSLFKGGLSKLKLCQVYTIKFLLRCECTVIIIILKRNPASTNSIFWTAIPTFFTWCSCLHVAQSPIQSITSKCNAQQKMACVNVISLTLGLEQSGEDWSVWTSWL
jgi:hypothetical protein